MAARKIFTLAISLLFAWGLQAQEDLEAMLLDEMEEPVEYTFFPFNQLAE